MAEVGSYTTVRWSRREALRLTDNQRGQRRERTALIWGRPETGVERGSDGGHTLTGEMESQQILGRVVVSASSEAPR